VSGTRDGTSPPPAQLGGAHEVLDANARAHLDRLIAGLSRGAYTGVPLQSADLLWVQALLRVLRSLEGNARPPGGSPRPDGPPPTA
jgi:hypothetical protein